MFVVEGGAFNNGKACSGGHFVQLAVSGPQLADNRECGKEYSPPEVKLMSLESEKDFFTA
jgi:hypothetical protein